MAEDVSGRCVADVDGVHSNARDLRCEMRVTRAELRREIREMGDRLIALTAILMTFLAVLIVLVEIVFP